MKRKERRKSGEGRNGWKKRRGIVKDNIVALEEKQGPLQRMAGQAILKKAEKETA